MALEEYRRKRDFGKTPEPAGEAVAPRGEGPPEEAPPGGAPREGAPRSGAPQAQPGALYVVQKHGASRLHYDFRLELDGVLLSWAIPKGPSLDPHDRHLAARTEDHPSEYGSFEGTIPKGEYGGGTVLLWDRGTWEPEGDAQEMLRKGDLKFTLHGEKLRGSWVLVRMKPRPEKGDKQEWLLIKHRDAEAVDGEGQRVLVERPESVASGRSLEEIAAAGEASVWHSNQPAGVQTGVHPGEEFALDPGALRGATPSREVPGFVAPELATLVKTAPAGEGWLHEIKLDGYRAVARVEAGTVRMFSRNEKDWTARYGSLVDELARLPAQSVVLDGEVVVMLPDGRTSFQELQRVLGEEGTRGTGSASARAGADAGAAGAPRSPDASPGEAGHLLYCVFDLLHLDGYDLTGCSIEDRKELLRRLLARAGQGGRGRLRYSDHIAGGGDQVFEQACTMRLEGIVSKRAGSPYRPGVRGGEWLKTKCKNQQEFVIGGYTDPAGARTGFGALLVGVREDGGLRYVGKVGTGFDDRSLDALAARLRDMRVETPAFTAGLDKAQKNAHWVRPDLVAEVEFAEWTRDGGIRHPSFKGLREDKPAGDVVAEVPMKETRKAAALPAAPTQGAAGPEAPSPAPAPKTPKSRAVAPAAAKAAPGGAPGATQINGVTITHPERVFWPVPGVTKLDLVRYYDSVAERMLPYVLDRPISMVRCPAGVEDGSAPGAPSASAAPRQRGGPPGCFFHKHPAGDFPGPVGRVMITESGGPAPYLTITGPGSLTALAQMGVLEIHLWGSTWPDIERPDMVVFDLDPGPGVEWPDLAGGARTVRDVLKTVHLESFVKTTGGKGLHVVVPLTPGEGWKDSEAFCRRVADIMVEFAPDRFTANMSKAKRPGKIFVDYVRNTRGSTAIAPFSTRAREQATVAVPLHWDEVTGDVRPNTFTVQTLGDRLRGLKDDPWEGYFQVRDSQRLDARIREMLGLS